MSKKQIFDWPADFNSAKVVYLPIPWDATTSYGLGASLGPQAILKASVQLDLFDVEVEKPHEQGLFLLEENPEIIKWNQEAQRNVKNVREKSSKQSLDRVNELTQKCNRFVSEQTLKLLNKNKIVGIIGGDHSVPFGSFQAHAEKFGPFGILHIDAHHDLRKAYEGFTDSHASIMFNAMENIRDITQLVQVGIRDFCEEEFFYAKEHKNRIRVFYDQDLQNKKFGGETWNQITQEIVKTLPQQVYISFDIDGLDPQFCPNTGTPVPGGLHFSEACFLIGVVARSGRKIIGFDLVEVAPTKEFPKGNEWDANVGMRLLYKLSAWALASQGMAKVL